MSEEIQELERLAVWAEKSVALSSTSAGSAICMLAAVLGRSVLAVLAQPRAGELTENCRHCGHAEAFHTMCIANLRDGHCACPGFTRIRT